MIRASLLGTFATALALVALPAAAQTADEHASHHPGGGASGAPGAPGGMAGTAPSGSPGAPGNTGSGMAGMMAPASSGGCMGGDCGSGGGKTPIYPSLMTLPALTPEKRAEIDALASQQIDEGIGRLTNGVELLEGAAQAGDHAAMQDSVGVMREGIDALGAGIAARRVLSEGKAPRNLALDWFKREMNLASPIPGGEARRLLGLAPFHIFTMVLLIAFAVAMLVMYFFKMRRAAALFGRLEPDSGAPPPRSTPPPGGPGPSAPAASPVGQPPGSGAAPPPDTPPALPATGPPAAAGTATKFSKASSGSPLTANWRGRLRIGSIVTETPSVKTFRLLPPSGHGLMPFTFLPGQFLNIAFGIGGARMLRSYSISSSPMQREYIDLTVRREPRGAVSRHMNDLLRVGDEIEAAGPVGRFTFTGTEAESIVLIAGGVGITPMMSITRYLTERSWAGDVFLIYSCRAPTDFMFANEIAALQRVHPTLRVAVTMSRAEGTDWKGPRGRITTELLTQTVPNLASRRIHLCGPPSMMDSTKAALTALGVPADGVKTELFGTPKPSPAVAGTTSKPTAPATGPRVTFAKSNRSANIHVDQSILELSEQLGVAIEYACRVGTCGVCKVTMTSGEVAMAVEDALEPDDRVNGIILACQAKPGSDVVVEA